MLPYPDTPRERDRWILAQRDGIERAALNAFEPNGFWVEDERAENGEVVSIATLLLINRECPWKCLMCDLWRHTLSETVPRNAILQQIEFALKQLPAARQIKLYNSGSFFDNQAIPPQDDAKIAARLQNFERVIVECHPALIGKRCLRFRELLGQTRLEVAMGLETAHPAALEKLNKRVTLEAFSRAAQTLRENNIALRVFALIQPPFVPQNEALYWAQRTIDFAFECGAAVVSLIATRGGNGAMETLQENGVWAPPTLDLLEKAVAYGIASEKGRVFADLWEIEPFLTCESCFSQRRARLEAMNFSQRVLPEIKCSQCMI